MSNQPATVLEGLRKRFPTLNIVEKHLPGGVVAFVADGRQLPETLSTDTELVSQKDVERLGRQLEEMNLADAPQNSPAPTV